MNQLAGHEPWPSELRLNPEKTALRVTFGDGVSESLSAELLRVNSPSAEVQGHSAAERKLVAGKRTCLDSRNRAGGQLRRETRFQRQSRYWPLLMAVSLPVGYG